MVFQTDERWHYDRFAELAGHCTEIIDLLESEHDDLSQKAQEAKAIESKADEVVKQVSVRLRSARRLPPGVQKSTILDIVRKIDDVIDGLEKAANRMQRFHMPLNESTSSMLSLIRESINELEGAIECLKSKSLDAEFEAHCERMKVLESQADRINRPIDEQLADEEDEAIESFGEKEGSPSYAEISDLQNILKHARRLGRVMGILEAAIDHCEDVSDLLETLKYEIE